MANTDKNSITNKILPLLLFTFALSALVFVFGNSLMTGSVSAVVSNSVSQWLQAIVDPWCRIDPIRFAAFVRKAAHFAEFFILGVVISFITGYYSRYKHFWLCAIPLFLTLLAAVSDEYLQTFVEARCGNMSDVLIDFAGGVLGTFIAYWICLVIIAVRRGKNQLSD